jgi:hypothetical protein
VPQENVLIRGVQSLSDDFKKPIADQFLEVATDLSVGNSDLTGKGLLPRVASSVSPRVPNQPAVGYLGTRRQVVAPYQRFGNEDSVEESVRVERLTGLERDGIRTLAIWTGAVFMYTGNGRLQCKPRNTASRRRFPLAAVVCEARF